MTYNSTYQI